MKKLDNIVLDNYKVVYAKSYLIVQVHKKNLFNPIPGGDENKLFLAVGGGVCSTPQSYEHQNHF